MAAPLYLGVQGNGKKDRNHMNTERMMIVNLLGKLKAY